MGAEVIDGRAIARQLQEELAGRIAALKGRGGRAGLALVRVGGDAASMVYVGPKEKACGELGVFSETRVLAESTREAELLALVERLNADERLHGILVQAPLPPQARPRGFYRPWRPERTWAGFNQVM